MIQKFRGFVFFLAISCILAACFAYFGNELLNEQTLVPASAGPQSQTDESEYDMNFDLEQKLVEKKTVKGYVIETYREYEIYKDAKGQVLKSVPTANYNYLRYKSKE